MQYGKLDEFLSELPPELQAAEYKNRPELEGWQQDLLDAFYALARGRQSGFDANPIPLVDLVLMALINDSVQFYGIVDLIEIWRELDTAMLDYWREQNEKDKKRKEELEKKAGKAN